MAAPSPLSVSERIRNIKMITTHAAKGQTRIEALTQVQLLLENADDALKRNYMEEANELCTRAWEIYKIAVRSGQLQDHQEKDEKILATLTTSIKALLKQAEEMNKENHGKNSGQLDEVKSLLTQAAATQDTAKARTIATQSYTILKNAMKDMRNGQTVTVDHAFSTPALKFADEMAYNDMHFDLLESALQQLGARPDSEYNIRVNNAKTLRKQAEAEAKQNEYAYGMRDLILSTQEIKEALNHVGLSIPNL